MTNVSIHGASPVVLSAYIQNVIPDCGVGMGSC